jgi:hypothetical protein
MSLFDFNALVYREIEKEMDRVSMTRLSGSGVTLVHETLGHDLNPNILCFSLLHDTSPGVDVKLISE